MIFREYDFENFFELENTNLYSWKINNKNKKLGQRDALN